MTIELKYLPNLSRVYFEFQIKLHFTQTPFFNRSIRNTVHSCSNNFRTGVVPDAKKYAFSIRNHFRSIVPMEAQSTLCFITNPPRVPLQFFLQLLEGIDVNLLSMNIATADSEYGVLNRTVMYRGITDGHVTFITQRDSRKYANIMEIPKVSVTFCLGRVNLENDSAVWQVRIFGEAVELNAEQISKYWESEPVFAKIRSRICECGKPVDHAELSRKHDALLKAYQNGEDQLPQTKTYTGFKIIPTVWDFYKSNASSIADRLLYKKQGSTWILNHVAA